MDKIDASRKYTDDKIHPIWVFQVPARNAGRQCNYKNDKNGDELDKALCDDVLRRALVVPSFGALIIRYHIGKPLFPININGAHSARVVQER